MRHQCFVAPAATRLPRGVDLLCGFDFMRRHAVSVSLPVRGEPSVVLQATGDHLPVLAKGAAVSDTPVVGAAMKGRLSERACDSDTSGVGPSAAGRRRPAAGAGVDVDAGHVAGEQATRPGGMFSDREEEDSGWDTPKESVVLIGREARVDTLDLGHVSKIQQRIETVDAQCRLGAADGWAYDEARRRVELAVGDWVLVHDLALGQGHGTPKFRPTFSTPAQIVATVTPLLYAVRYQDRRSRKMVRIQVQRLQLCRPHPAVRTGRGAAAARPGGGAGMIDARSESSASEDGEDSDHDPGEEESEVQGSDEEPTVDLSTYQVLKSDGHDNVLAFNEPGGYALWLHKSDVPDAALTRFWGHERDRQWRKQVQKRLKCLNVLNEPGE